MRALVVESGHVRISEIPAPQPGQGEVLVRVAASGVTTTDINERSGHGAPDIPTRHRIPGCQLAGVVAANGTGATRFALGTPVMGMSIRGAQAEYVAVPERQLLEVPEMIGWPAAAAIPDAFGTACDALLMRGGLVRGQRLLITGACPGVTAAAIQVGGLIGARVTAALYSSRARTAAEQMGAETISPDQIPGSGPYDVVLLLVSGFVNDALWAVADKGIITLAGSHDPVAEINVAALLVKHAALLGSGLPLRSAVYLERICRMIETHCLAALARGDLMVPVGALFSLERAEEAYIDAIAAWGLDSRILVADPSLAQSH